MSWNRCPIILMLLAPDSCAMAALPAVRCPTSLMAEGHSYSLSGMSVFDGLPKNQVDLQPLTTGKGTKATDRWDLASLWETGDRQPYAVCDYDGTKQTKVFKVLAGTKSCINIGDPVRSECR